MSACIAGVATGAPRLLSELTLSTAIRTNAEQVTVFDSVGFALEDFSALTFIRDTAAEFGIGEFIELVPRGEDPKDLFGLLCTEQKGLAPVAPARRTAVVT